MLLLCSDLLDQESAILSAGREAADDDEEQPGSRAPGLQDKPGLQRSKCTPHGILPDPSCVVNRNAPPTVERAETWLLSTEAAVICSIAVRDGAAIVLEQSNAAVLAAARLSSAAADAAMLQASAQREAARATKVS